jgi:hypothetical protein
VRIAGHEVAVPMTVWRQYVRVHPKTIEEYDLAGHGDPAILIREEVRRTRRISSRISSRECELFVGQWPSSGAADIPMGAHIGDADPLQPDGLYGEAQRVVGTFIANRGIGYTKAYKVLHIKRPHLYPLLDSRLRALYKQPEREYRETHKRELPDRSRCFWGPIRQDVLANKSALDEYRDELRAQTGLLSQLADLSDLRLLDIAAWQIPIVVRMTDRIGPCTAARSHSSDAKCGPT